MLISAFPVAAASIVIREFVEALVTLGVELFRLRVIAVRVMNSPGPNEDCAVFWDKHSFVIVIWNDVSLYTDININVSQTFSCPVWDTCYTAITC